MSICQPYGTMAILGKKKYKWLVTGAAGFIGSHLVEALLLAGQKVTGLDNFSTGHMRNLDAVRDSVGEKIWPNFQLVTGDIRSPADCSEACAEVDYVLHQAALGSVPRSIQDPLASNDSNVNGFLNLLIASRDAGVKRIVYASSSAVYGDSPDSAKKEERLGRPLSPYAVTKLADELYAGVFVKAYGISAVGLRYFNVFGPRQDPNGPYAAVIPVWTSNLFAGKECVIYGDGETSRDFSHIDNIVQANVLAATAPGLTDDVFNIACGKSLNLFELYLEIRSLVSQVTGQADLPQPVFQPFRAGDIRHSLADISRAVKVLGYEPLVFIKDGLRDYMRSFPRGSEVTFIIDRAGDIASASL